jgi:hypothetical protein
LHTLLLTLDPGRRQLIVTLDGTRMLEAWATAAHTEAVGTASQRAPHANVTLLQTARSKQHLCMSIRQARGASGATA